MQQLNFPSAILWLGRWLLISILSVVCAGVSGIVADALVGLPNGEPHSDTMIMVLLVASIEALVLVGLAASIAGSWWRRFLILCVYYHLTKYGLMMVEAAFFLNLWNSSPLISLVDIAGFEVYGLLVSILISSLVVSLIPAQVKPLNSRSQKLMFKPLMLMSVTYTACYLFAGALIFIPLAGDTYQSTYGQLTVPMWMPLLQLVRGVVWAYLVWMMVSNISLSPSSKAVMIGLSLAVFAAAQLLVPNAYMVAELRNAHIIELVVSMFVFGWLSARLLNRYSRTPA